MKWIGRTVDSVADEQLAIEKAFGTITDSSITAVNGFEYLINDANGGAFALPPATEGNQIIVNIGTSITSSSLRITCPSGVIFVGFAFMKEVANETSSANNVYVHFAPDTSADDNTMALNGGTQGGLVGDRIIFGYHKAGVWQVSAWLSHTGTAATPFS